ncbi:MAG: PilZ domain-containing protein, partial [Deltaproteobacteria bacterium]|nr:PilZ domain-containing protein [Deltaproteobacteria bacterium]
MANMGAGPKKNNEKNNRSNKRVDFFNKVKIVIPDTDTAIDVFAANMSKGGIFLRSNRPLPKGKTVRLQFETEKGSVEVDEGEVIWSKPFEPISIDGEQPGMGIKFRNMSETSRKHIESFIAEALSDSPKAPLPPPPPPPVVPKAPTLPAQAPALPPQAPAALPPQAPAALPPQAPAALPPQAPAALPPQ